MAKKVTTKKDVRAVMFLTDYIERTYFGNRSKIAGDEYEDISAFIESSGGNVGPRTIGRCFGFTSKIHPVTYAKLDDIVIWAFEGKYKNFVDFLEKETHKIDNFNLVSSEELDVLFEEFLNRKTLSVKEKKVSLNNSVQTYNPSADGLVSQLFDAITPIVGDFVYSKIKKDTKVIISDNSRINNRLQLKEERRQINIEKIVKKSIKFIKGYEASRDEVDPDWLIEFFETSQDFSNENMQYLWAKILAGEIENPSSFSRRTLNVLKSISSEEAELFSMLSNCLWTLEGENVDNAKMLITDSDENNEYTDFEWGFDRRDLYLLEDLGLVEESIYILNTSKHSYNLSFFNIKHSVKASRQRTELDIIRLTKVGEEIYSIVQKSVNDEYYRYIRDYLKKRKIID